MSNLKDADSNYKSQLSAGTTVSVEVPTLKSYDTATKLVTCEARVTFNWPGQITSRLLNLRPGIDWAKDTNSGTYGVQPQADGNGLVYSLSDPILDGTVGSAREMLATLSQADADAQAKAEAAKAPPPAEASSTDASGAAAEPSQGTGPAPEGPAVSQ